MKKITFTLIIILLFAPLLSLTIKTTDGRTVKGEFVKKQDTRYTIKTITGSIVVFEEEIEQVVSDAGTDVTTSFLAIVSEPLFETPAPGQFQANQQSMAAARIIATPIWVLFAVTSGTFLYTIAQ